MEKSPENICAGVHFQGIMIPVKRLQKALLLPPFVPRFVIKLTRFVIPVEFCNKTDVVFDKKVVAFCNKILLRFVIRKLPRFVIIFDAFCNKYLPRF